MIPVDSPTAAPSLRDRNPLSEVSAPPLFSIPNRSMVASVPLVWSLESMDFVVWWSLQYGAPCAGRETLVVCFVLVLSLFFRRIVHMTKCFVCGGWGCWKIAWE